MGRTSKRPFKFLLNSKCIVIQHPLNDHVTKTLIGKKIKIKRSYETKNGDYLYESTEGYTFAEQELEEYKE